MPDILPSDLVTVRMLDGSEHRFIVMDTDEPRWDEPEKPFRLSLLADPENPGVEVEER